MRKDLNIKKSRRKSERLALQTSFSKFKNSADDPGMEEKKQNVDTGIKQKKEKTDAAIAKPVQMKKKLKKKKKWETIEIRNGGFGLGEFRVLSIVNIDSNKVHEDDDFLAKIPKLEKKLDLIVKRKSKFEKALADIYKRNPRNLEIKILVERYESIFEDKPKWELSFTEEADITIATYVQDLNVTRELGDHNNLNQLKDGDMGADKDVLNTVNDKVEDKDSKLEVSTTIDEGVLQKPTAIDEEALKKPVTSDECPAIVVLNNLHESGEKVVKADLVDPYIPNLEKQAASDESSDAELQKPAASVECPTTELEKPEPIDEKVVKDDLDPNMPKFSFRLT
ncbi:hypothetical protein L1987_53203 [Smallanthus sonchifolius]|uniref:Uncharacterized protein n=1 Tax=Smallanthus sonchifolius TaxID=185202 RepID=A0ACB9EWG0_9ASTR|nr:hypothetical protein L1987_53203 [Smallanthus sonchifolius]